MSFVTFGYQNHNLKWFTQLNFIIIVSTNDPIIKAFEPYLTDSDNNDDQLTENITKSNETH
jgi:hypothetical protein